MSFGQFIREAWPIASEEAKQQINKISSGEQNIPYLSQTYQTETELELAKKVSQGFEVIDINFSDCFITKPIMNEPEKTENG